MSFKSAESLESVGGYEQNKYESNISMYILRKAYK